MLGFWGSGCRVGAWGVGFGVWGPVLGCGGADLGLWQTGLGLGVMCLGMGISGLGEGQFGLTTYRVGFWGSADCVGACGLGIGVRMNIDRVLSPEKDDIVRRLSISAS